MGELGQGVVAAAAGHAQVEHDEIGMPGRGELERTVTVVGHGDVRPSRGERAAVEQPDIRLVVAHKDPHIAERDESGVRAQWHLLSSYGRNMAEPPVLLVHGFASSFERNWREPGWVDLLSDAGREVIGLDLLGHGSADKPHDPAAYADLHEDVAAALPEEPAVAVDAIGFSMGAMLLLRVAASQPERFNRIVIGGVGQNAFGRGDSEAIAAAIEQGPADESHPIARLFANFAASPDNDPAALAACMRRKTTPLTKEDAGRISCPVLVVLGDKDFAAPGEPLVDALPNARLVMLPGVDHFATPKDFKFLDAALDFLGALP